MRWILPLLTVSLIAGCGGDESQQVSTSETTQTTADSTQTSTPDIVQAGAETAAPEQPTTAQPPSGPAVPVVTAEQVLQQVDLLIQQRQFNQAVNVLNQLIAQRRDIPEAYLKRAAIYAEAKLFSRAIADMSRAIELQPRNARLRNTRGYFYLSQNDLDRAMTDFDDAIGLDLEYHQPYNNRGLVRIAREDFQGALLDFDAALRIDPDYLDALNNRGFALMRLERFEEAIENFTAVLDKKDDYVNAWNNRGLAHAGIEQHEAAAADFSRAIELQPGNLKYYLHRSASYEALGRTEEAAADRFMITWIEQLARLNQEIGRDQQNPSAWIARGRHFIAAKRYNDAVSDFNRALAESPQSSAAHIALAEVWRLQGDAEQALAEATRAIECGPSHAAYSLRGDMHFEQQNFEAAIADYEAARRFDSQVVQAYRQCSEQLLEAGETERASALLERATQIESRIQFGETPPAAESTETPAEEAAQSAAAADETTTQ